MDLLQDYESEDSDENIDRETSNTDFFGINSVDECPEVCKHGVVLFDDKTCWKCEMEKYEQINLSSGRSCGPDIDESSLKRIHSEVPPRFLCNIKERKIKDGFFREQSSEKKNYHDKCITEVNFLGKSGSPNLLLTCSLDGYIKLWQLDVCRNKCEPLNILALKIAKTAVRSAKWSICGSKIISGDFDGYAKLLDADTGQELFKQNHDCYVTSVLPHPTDENLYICGCSKGLHTWDVRMKDEKPVKLFSRNFGEVRDILFLRNQSELLCCTDTVERESADRSIIAWDFQSGALLSNQIYQERYSCTALRMHPTDNTFLAQSNGNYIAVFSSKNPYKMNKKKRFGNHKLSGYGVTFDTSIDGQSIASGSMDGKAYFYNYFSGKNFKTSQIFRRNDPLITIQYHPLSTSKIAAGSWSGELRVISL